MKSDNGNDHAVMNKLFTRAKRVRDGNCARDIRGARRNLLDDLGVSMCGEAFSTVAFRNYHAHEALLFKGVPQVLW